MGLSINTIMTDTTSALIIKHPEGQERVAKPGTILPEGFFPVGILSKSGVYYPLTLEHDAPEAQWLAVVRLALVMGDDLSRFVN